MLRHVSTAIACLLASTALHAQDAELAITNVTIIDVERGVALEGRSVTVSDGKITTIAPSMAGPIRADDVIDGAGKFLIPGLIDMHVHTDRSGLPLYLGHGVTTVRDMGTHFAPLEPGSRGQLAMRQDIADGSLAGPEMVLALRILDGDLPRNPRWAMHYAAIATPEQGRDLVNKVADAGGDFVKVYTDLTPDVFAAIADEAKRRGLTISGHVPGTVGYEAAAKAGLRTAEHLRGLFIDLSSEEAQWREAFAAEVAKGEVSATYRFVHENLLAMAETYDEEKAQRLFALLRREGVGIVPTLVVLDDPRWMYPSAMPDPSLTEQLSGIYKSIVTPRGDPRGPFATVADALKARDKRIKLVGDMHDAGVDILVGTDASNPFVVPGISMHEELGNLVDAGMTPAEVLRAATLVNARFLEAEDRLGSIAVGKEADLVLLDRNPLEDIAATRAISNVIVNGSRYSPPEEDTGEETARR